VQGARGATRRAVVVVLEVAHRSAPTGSVLCAKNVRP
jgi:hypothetical protein